VELRPEDNVEPSFSRVAWWLWRLEDMKWIGHCGVRRAEGSVYTAGVSIWRSRGRYTGGYGAEAYRLMCGFAVNDLGATRILAVDTNLDRKSSLEEAGFKLASAFPPQHAKRRRGYGIRRYEWTP